MNKQPTGEQRAPWSDVLERTATASALVWGRLPRVGRLRGGAGAGRVLHSEWAALLERFVDNGTVDYRALQRVQRLFETYLERLAATAPDTFADTGDQLAFYLNAYNAVALYQAAQHYPLASIRAVPYAFVRPFPVGGRNVGLVQIHGTLVRAFGDPRVHAALCPAARGAPILPGEPFVGTRLQQQLDDAMRRLLADPTRGARYDADTNTLHIASVLHRWRGDWIAAHRMPGIGSIIAGRLQPDRLVPALLPYMPPALADQIKEYRPTVAVLPFDWALNDMPT